MGRLITVFSDGNTGAENRISGSQFKLAENGSPRTWIIQNQSEGGLRITTPLNLGANSLQFRGAKATLVNRLSGTGNITVYTGLTGSPTHLVLGFLNAYSGNWSGALDVQFQAMVVTRWSGVIFGTGANNVQNGGTVAWRDTNSSGSSIDPQPFTVRGQGVERQTGIDRVGAVYNDGGKNTFNGPIHFTGATWFGSRGDIDGSLQLGGKIDGGAANFVKVGPGLIILANAQNTWGRTALSDGVLRATDWSHLSSANILFSQAKTNQNGSGTGGILESNNAASFDRALGQSANQIWWANGDGGFSSYGDQATEFSVNGGTALTWGQQYFVRNGRALLLGSRYSNNQTIFSNPISLGTSATGAHREVRVEAALTPNAYGVLSGNITSPGSSVQYDGDGNAIGVLLPTTGLLKTGEGLLKLTHTVPNTPLEDWVAYLYPLIIRGGALLKPDEQASPVRLDAGPSGTGGVLGVNVAYASELGTGLNQIQWTGSGGFAGYGNYVYGWGDIVQINGGAELEWGVTPYFLAANDELRFGHYTATNAILWGTPLKLGDGTKTIRVARGQHDGPDVDFREPISSPNGAILEVVGDGRMDIQAYIDKLRISHLRVKGAEFRLGGNAYLAASDIIMEATHSGTITLDGTLSTQESLIHVLTRYAFNAGNLLYIGKLGPHSYESANEIKLLGGHNSIELSKSLMWPESSQSPDMRYTIHTLSHDHVSATLNAISNRTFATTTGIPNVRLQVDNAAIYEFGTADKKVIPWMTVNGTDFAKTTLANGETYIQPQVIYHDATALGNWTANNNIYLPSGTVTLDADKTINALKISDGTLQLSNRTLTIGSGGLLSTGTGNTKITGIYSYLSEITTGNINRPLYIHVYNNRLTFQSISIIEGVDLVKTGPGELELKSGTHQFPNLYINEGLVSFNFHPSILRVDTVYIGDGAGTDILSLSQTTDDDFLQPLTGNSSWPKIVLRGTPYDSRGPEYGGPQAILRMDNTIQHLRELHIENRGTIDWGYGIVGESNILYLDNLTFSGPDAILFMKNWYEYEDRLLVKQYGGFDPAYLQNIRFEGYENFPVIMRKYDWQYWEITPFGTDDTIGFMPEPSTYGAILGAVGLGLVAWRRKRRRANEPAAK